ncbi:MAG: hypothetical protein ABIP94_17105 [Planctomycetota bacterium]
MHYLAFAVLTTLITAQQPATPPAHDASDLEMLARRVDTAHRPNGPVRPITAFQCNLELHVLAASAKERGQVDLSVKFLQWQRPGRDDVRPLIRYEVREAGTPIMRGVDGLGPWQLVQGEARDLRGSERGEDLAACERHMNLARQLLRCLDPGAVLRSLTSPSPVREEELPLDRTRIPCETVEGNLPAFPLLQQGGEDASAHLKVYVDKTDGRLLAIDAWPLEGGKQVDARGERVQLRDLHVRNDLLVPRKLEHFFRRPDGSLELQTRVMLINLSLRPELTVEDFARPKN